MTPFELLEPGSLREAIAVLDPDDPTVRPIAGGTALMLMMKAGVFRPTRLVSLRKLGQEHARIAAGPGRRAHHRRHDAARGGRALGRGRARRAGDPARHAAALQRPRAQRRDHRRQSRARRSAHGPAAGADRARRAAYRSPGRPATRTIAVEDLFAGYYETVLAKNELIAELRVPAQGKTRAAYLKVTTGSADDWPALGVAVALEADGADVKSARVVVSAATEKAIAPQERRAGARRRRRGRQDARARRRRRGRRRPNASPTSAARPPTSASSLRVYVGRAVRQALQEQALAGNGAADP